MELKNPPQPKLWGVVEPVALEGDAGEAVRELVLRPPPAVVVDVAVGDAGGRPPLLIREAPADDASDLTHDAGGQVGGELTRENEAIDAGGQVGGELAWEQQTIDAADDGEIVGLEIDGVDQQLHAVVQLDLELGDISADAELVEVEDDVGAFERLVGAGVGGEEEAGGDQQEKGREDPRHIQHVVHAPCCEGMITFWTPSDASRKQQRIPPRFTFFYYCAELTFYAISKICQIKKAFFRKKIYILPTSPYYLFKKTTFFRGYTTLIPCCDATHSNVCRE